MFTTNFHNEELLRIQQQQQQQLQQQQLHYQYQQYQQHYENNPGALNASSTSFQQQQTFVQSHESMKKRKLSISDHPMHNEGTNNGYNQSMTGIYHNNIITQDVDDHNRVRKRPYRPSTSSDQSSVPISIPYDHQHQQQQQQTSFACNPAMTSSSFSSSFSSSPPRAPMNSPRAPMNSPLTQPTSDTTMSMGMAPLDLSGLFPSSSTTPTHFDQPYQNGFYNQGTNITPDHANARFGGMVGAPSASSSSFYNMVSPSASDMEYDAPPLQWAKQYYAAKQEQQQSAASKPPHPSTSRITRPRAYSDGQMVIQQHLQNGQTAVSACELCQIGGSGHLNHVCHN